MTVLEKAPDFHGLVVKWAGMTLETWLKSIGPTQTPSTLKKIIFQTTWALHCISWDLKLVHNDLHCNNICLREIGATYLYGHNALWEFESAWEVKIIDWAHAACLPTAAGASQVAIQTLLRVIHLIRQYWKQPTYVASRGNLASKELDTFSREVPKCTSIEKVLHLAYFSKFVLQGPLHDNASEAAVFHAISTYNKLPDPRMSRRTTTQRGISPASQGGPAPLPHTNLPKMPAESIQKLAKPPSTISVNLSSTTLFSPQPPPIYPQSPQSTSIRRFPPPVLVPSIPRPIHKPAKQAPPRRQPQQNKGSHRGNGRQETLKETIQRAWDKASRPY